MIPPAWSWRLTGRGASRAPPAGAGAVVTASRLRSRRSAPQFGDAIDAAPGLLRRHHRLRRRASGPTTCSPGSRTRPSQHFDYLTDVTAVEYRDPERPLEVVWQLRSLAAQGRPPGQGRARQARAARGPLGLRPLARRRLAGARGVRHVRRGLHRTPRPAPHPDVGDLRRGLSAAEGFPAARATSAGPSRPGRRSRPIPRPTTPWKSCPSPRRSTSCPRTCGSGWRAASEDS